MKMTCELPDHASVVEALLEGFVRACLVIITAGLAPPDPRETAPRVKYKLEPPGEEDWKLPHNVIRDGWGDCEDLAGWRAAGLRFTGEDGAARVKVVKTGENKLHAVVERSDGTLDDVCKEMWLNQPEGQKRLKMLGASASDVFKVVKPGQVVAPNGTIIDTSALPPAVVRDHRPGGNAATSSDYAAYQRDAYSKSHGGQQPTGRQLADWLNSQAINPTTGVQYTKGKEVQAPAGTNWVQGRSSPSIDPNTGEPYLVNPQNGYTTPYGQQQYGLPPGPAQYNPYDPYGGYGQQMYNPYDPYGYGQQMYAPSSWFQQSGRDPWGPGGWQGDGSWVDPRAVQAFSSAQEDDDDAWY